MQMWTTFAINSRRDKEMTLTTARPLPCRPITLSLPALNFGSRDLSAMCRNHENSNVIL